MDHLIIYTRDPRSFKQTSDKKARNSYHLSSLPPLFVFYSSNKIEKFNKFEFLN